MIPYLLPILGGIASIGFAGVSVVSYVNELSSERLDWLDRGLSGLIGKEDFNYGIAVRFEDLSGNASSCDENWVKNDNLSPVDSCEKIKGSWDKIKQLLNGDKLNQKWSEISSEIQNLDHTHSQCGIFSWSPNQITNDVGLKEAVKVALEWHCFNAGSEERARQFEKFFKNVGITNIDTKQDSQLIGGIIAGVLDGSLSGWQDTLPEGTLQVQEWNIIANGVLKSAEDRNRFKFQSRLEEDKGWSLVKLRDTENKQLD